MNRITLLAIVAFCLSVPTQADGGIFRRMGHQGMVAQSGITPHRVGTHEGVGMSSRSYNDARNNACFWGQRQALTVQYSKRGGMYYAVVRYR